MPSNAIIFVVLVSGFLALRLFDPTRYLSQAWDTTRVVLWSGVAGGLIFGLVRIGVLVVRDFTPVGPPLKKFADWAFPISFSGTLIATCLASVAVAAGLNLASRRWTWISERLDNLTRYQVHSLNAFLRDEWKNERDLLFTLDDGKVYVAIVFAEPLQTPREAYVEILPTKSGYRDKDTRNVEITRDYSELIDHVEKVFRSDPKKGKDALRLLRVLIPFDRIVSIHGWDATVSRASRPAPRRRRPRKTVKDTAAP